MNYRLILLLALFFGCTKSKKTPMQEKDDDLKGYFSSAFQSGISTKDEQIIILNNQSCSSCRREILTTLVEKLSKIKTHRTYLLMTKDTTLISSISMDKNSTIKIDNSGKAADFGLAYASDFIYSFKNDKLKRKFEISNTSVKNLVPEKF